MHTVSTILDFKLHLYLVWLCNMFSTPTDESFGSERNNNEPQPRKPKAIPLKESPLKPSASVTTPTLAPQNLLI